MASPPSPLRPSWERLAFAGAWALILAPVLAHGLWRPLIVGLGVEGDAAWVTIAALLVAAAVVLGRWLRPTRAWLAWATPGVTAIALELWRGSRVLH